MFENTGRTFKDVSANSGTVFSKMFSGRGMALGDFDNDGDADVLTSNNGEPPLLLRNQGGNRNNWVGPASGRDEKQLRGSRSRDYVAVRNR